MAPGPSLLAVVRRGAVDEVVVRGHVAVVDAAGRPSMFCGDPEAETTLRSAVKPLQAMPFLATGACDRLGATDAELALACASHQGEPEHVATARRLLARAGVDESALLCGPQPPASAEAAWQLAASGGKPLSIHNNCSGKHSAMIATCVDQGWPLDAYIARGHPLQRAVSAVLGRFTGIDIDSAPCGIDGCGLPTYGVPLRALARAFAAATSDAHFRRCQAAMAAHPWLVGGTGRFDTAVLEAAGDRLTSKIGGAAVWVAVARPSGPAVAIKLEAGTGEHIPAIALAVLQQLEMLPRELPETLREFAQGAVRNWAGAGVGETSTCVQLVRV
jgi:L-asparaginase II